MKTRVNTIKVKYLGPTNFKGSRVKIITSNESITIPYDYKFNSALDIAVNYLESNGFNIIGVDGWHKDCAGYIISDTFDCIK